MSKNTAHSLIRENTFPEYAEVALPVPLRRTFTYRLPAGLREEIGIGSRVLVPFGKRRLTGYAVVLHEELNMADLEIEESKIRDVLELLDAEPLFTEEILRLTQWVSDYYASSWGEVLKAALPAGINATTEVIYSITAEGRDELFKVASATTQKVQMLKFLASEGDSSGRELAKKFGAAPSKRALRELIGHNWVRSFHRTITTQTKPKRRKAVRLLPPEKHDPDNQKTPTPAQERVISALLQNDGEMLFTKLIEAADVGASPVNTLARRGIVEVFVREIRRDPLAEAELPEITDLVLTDEQEQVLGEIKEVLNEHTYQAFLLHGVTGSGKTEIYIRAMQTALNQGRSALMLVPEIALTPIFSKRLRAVFGDEVAILHSSLSTGERFDEWRRIRAGKARVAIGTRSAVFAPLENLGIVIIDEEHDGSYRQHDMPFYHGRDTGVVRAKFSDAVVVLGSATPALESFHNAQTGKYKYLHLPNRIGNRPLAKAELIDMREVFKDSGDKVFAPQLIEAIEATHARGEQSMILLNRRGFSSFVLCRSCGETIRCGDCDITLTYHRKASRLVCHYCNHREKAPAGCPHCQSRYLFFVGEGTEQIENILRRKFSGLRIARVDRDTTRRKNELEQTLSAFDRGEIDMLVGTQMLAKGHDFHNVTLVGVVSVDAGLALPDFRSAERTFQLLTQVAGRAGRGSLRGRVLIQTYHPEHYALRHAATQSYRDFYEVEVNFRRRLKYPPFVALASILIKHQSYNYAFDNALLMSESLKKMDPDKKCVILGPAPAPLARLKGEHRLQILVKAQIRNRLRQTIDFALAEAENRFCDLRTVYVEIDPVNLL